MHKHLLLISLFFITPTLSQAEEKYRYPADLSEEEHLTMMQSQQRYTDCLNKESQAILDKYEDFRQIADVAMENCKKSLTEIDQDLEKMNLDPDFRRFFLRKTSQGSARKLLPSLMAAKSK